MKRFLKKATQKTATKSQDTDNNNNTPGNLHDFQPKPDFVEKKLLIPIIAEQVDIISRLFNEMTDIYHQLNKEGKYRQDYKKDFELAMIDYYKMKFINQQSFNIEKNIIQEEANKLRKTLLDGISRHLQQYTDHLNTLIKTSPKEENNMEKISEHIIKVKSLMSNLIHLKDNIFSIILPMTTLTVINSKTKEEVQRINSDHPVLKIGLLPFETRLDEIVLICKNGIQSIDLWLEHLKNKRIRYLENIVNQSQVQAAQEQTKAAKMTFRTQRRFMWLSILFIIVSFCLAEYKEEWIEFFSYKKSLDK